ncbi:MAG: DUF4129 domain-containing protein [Tannerella sp.]|jgi:hypothetical protein|nr:DUF4129 domain-containing protein [Tannerella sp.]
MTFAAATDTIAYNTAKIAEYQSDKRFDYAPELEFQGDSILDYINRLINSLLNKLFGMTDESAGYWVMIGIFVAAAILIVYFIYRKRPEIFVRDRKRPLEYAVEEENIYEIDFESELDTALATANYRQAVRIIYLQALRFAADRKWIDWQIFKTPTEYTYEFRPAQLKAIFRSMTNSFLQVRYGNFRATNELVAAMIQMRDELMKGGGDETQNI